MEHLKKGTATHTADGEARGFIDFSGLKQLWIHTGTACNLRCPSCFEQAGPGDARIQAMTLDEARPVLDEAARLGVQSFGFTGGEPFMNRDFMRILAYALDLAPCLVLSNGTEPLRACLDDLNALNGKKKAHGLTIRVSLDYPDALRHDAERGAGHFATALETLRKLNEMGIAVTVARRMEDGEDAAKITAAYAALFEKNSLPPLPLVAFPNLQSSGSTPEISEGCISKYHTPASCAGFMCAYSRMLVKKDGRVTLYACTLVDDDPAYDFGPELGAALKTRTLLRHKRCFPCFAGGVSCGG